MKTDFIYHMHIFEWPLYFVIANQGHTGLMESIKDVF